MIFLWRIWQVLQDECSWSSWAGLYETRWSIAYRPPTLRWWRILSLYL
jgi:hypothetical protein